MVYLYIDNKYVNSLIYVRIYKKFYYSDFSYFPKSEGKGCDFSRRNNSMCGSGV